MSVHVVAAKNINHEFLCFGCFQGHVEASTALALSIVRHLLCRGVVGLLNERACCSRLSVTMEGGCAELGRQASLSPYLPYVSC